jgi:hypothetical protein
LDLADKRKGLIVAPMPRYWNQGCCDNEQHATNIGDFNYKQNMLDALEVRRNLKDFLWYDGKLNFKVVDPAFDLKGMAEENMWGVDPVHPKPAKLAEAVVKIAATMEATDGKRRRTGSLKAGSSREPTARPAAGAPAAPPCEGGLGSREGGIMNNMMIMKVGFQNRIFVKVGFLQV